MAPERDKSEQTFKVAALSIATAHLLPAHSHFSAFVLSYLA